MSPPRYYSFFRNVKKEPRRFQYKHRFYDPKKEELEARKRRIEREIARERGEESEYRPGSVNFRNSWRRRKSASRSHAKSATLRLVVILIILCGFLYLAIDWLDGLDGLFN